MLGDGRRAAALAATRATACKEQRQLRRARTDSPRLRLQAAGPAPSAAARLAPPTPPTTGVKLGPPVRRAGALASDWPRRYPPHPLPASSLARKRRVRNGPVGSGIAECGR
jgi:hypothetical protein